MASIAGGLGEELVQGLYAVLPPAGVGLPARRVARVRGLPVHVTPARRVPHPEGRAGQQRVGGGLGQARPLQVGLRNGNGERRVEVVVERRRHTVEVGLVLEVHGDRLEGHGLRLVLREVHERVALVVAAVSGVSYREEKRECVFQNRMCVSLFPLYVFV